MGVEVLRVVNPLYIRLAVGVVVVFSALLLLRDIRLPGAETRWGTVVAGSTSGALSTSTGLAGPPIVLLLASRGLPKRVFRGSSAMYLDRKSTRLNSSHANISYAGFCLKK